MSGRERERESERGEFMRKPFLVLPVKFIDTRNPVYFSKWESKHGCPFHGRYRVKMLLFIISKHQHVCVPQNSPCKVL